MTEEQKREVDELIAKERRYQEDNAVEDDAESEVFGEPDEGGAAMNAATQADLEFALRWIRLAKEDLAAAGDVSGVRRRAWPA